jgi:hypothetical protein
MNNRAEILLRWGNLETPQDLSAETQNFVSGDPSSKIHVNYMAAFGYKELGIVPVFFVNSLPFKITAKGYSAAGEWENLSWSGSLIQWTAAATSRIALAHELGHSLGRLGDLWCLPGRNPIVTVSPNLMASDCTFQGDDLSDEERTKWRGQMSSTP